MYVYICVCCLHLYSMVIMQVNLLCTMLCVQCPPDLQARATAAWHVCRLLLLCWAACQLQTCMLMQLMHVVCAGSYSYVGLHANSKTYDDLALPVQRRVLFAGEHTCKVCCSTPCGRLINPPGPIQASVASCGAPVTPARHAA